MFLIDLGKVNHLRIVPFLPPSLPYCYIVFSTFQVEGNDKMCYVLVFMKPAVMYFIMMALSPMLGLWYSTSCLCSGRILRFLSPLVKAYTALCVVILLRDPLALSSSLHVTQ